MPSKKQSEKWSFYVEFGKSRRNESFGQSGKKGEVKKKVKRGEMMVKTFSPDNRGSFLHEQKLQEQSSCLLFASF